MYVEVTELMTAACPDSWLSLASCRVCLLPVGSKIKTAKTEPQGVCVCVHAS